jgi:RNA polymerase sigma-70 factor (ECF subfamily)
MKHLDELVKRHIGKVRSMAYSMVLNHSDADDVTQEVFIRMSRGIGGFHGKAKFTSWLHRITVNTTMDFLRCRSRCPVDDREEMPVLPDPRPGPEKLADAWDLGNDIRCALVALSPRLRAALTMVAIQGLSTQEVAHACGCLPATLSWRVHQARRIMRDILNKRGAL